MSVQDDLDRGIKAEKLLADPLVQEAFDAVAKAIHEQWEAAPLRDVAGQHELKLMLKLLGEVKAVFELAVVDGKVAAEDIKREREKVLSPKQWMGR